MKVLAKFIGRLNEFHEPPDFSYCTLKNVDTGETVESNAVSEKLKAAGICKDGDEFEVLIQQDDAGKMVPVMRKLEPRQVTEEQANSIVNEVDHRLNGEGSYDI